MEKSSFGVFERSLKSDKSNKGENNRGRGKRRAIPRRLKSALSLIQIHVLLKHLKASK